MTIALVAAQAENRVIGQGLDIPWRVKGEQALFKQITMGGTRQLVFCVDDPDGNVVEFMQFLRSA